MRGDQKGFTIVELLIVVVVIAILAAITIVAYNGIQTRARDSSRDAAVKHLRTALEMYKADNADIYPNACGNPSLGCNVTSLASALVPKYMSSIPVDPSSSRTINYVVSMDYAGYGIYVKYESKPECKHLVGMNTNNGWWGTVVPTCS